jgi:hypothetical protein
MHRTLADSWRDAGIACPRMLFHSLPMPVGCGNPRSAAAVSAITATSRRSQRDDGRRNHGVQFEGPVFTLLILVVRNVGPKETKAKRGRRVSFRERAAPVPP